MGTLSEEAGRVLPDVKTQSTTTVSKALKEIQKKSPRNASIPPKRARIRARALCSNVLFHTDIFLRKRAVSLMSISTKKFTPGREED